MPSAISLESQPDAAQDHKSEKAPAVNEAKSLSSSALRRAADFPVLTSDGTKVLFKSLYQAEPGQRKRTLIIFIRHFFCGNCQEYVRSLKAQIPPDSLPADLSIAIVGCGSHTLIDSYITETDCPYPIYTDPSKRLYDALGLHRSLSLGWKDPDYIQHTLVAGMMKSIVQSFKRFPAGDALSGGDMRLNGGEFLFNAEGGVASGKGSDGIVDPKAVSVAWCHRMVNSRNHTEVEEIRTIVGLEWETSVRRRPQRRWTSDASRVRRSLSSRRESWLQRTNSLSRNSSPKQARESRQSSRRRRSPTAAEGAIREEVRSQDGIPTLTAVRA